MDLQFERGDSTRPRGHAIIYFEVGERPGTYVATYVVVPPVSIELTKYLPPMFAGRSEFAMTSEVSAIPLPPVPENIEDLRDLQRLAEFRDDDLVRGGNINGGPERLLQSAAEASQDYLSRYQRALEAHRSTSEPTAELDFDVEDMVYAVLNPAALVSELAKLTGQLRYAIEGNDAAQIGETVKEIQRVGSRLPESYRIADFVRSARLPGNPGQTLAELYLSRCYRLAAEDYSAVAKIDSEIAAAERDL